MYMKNILCVCAGERGKGGKVKNYHVEGKHEDNNKSESCSDRYIWY